MKTFFGWLATMLFWRFVPHRCRFVRAQDPYSGCSGKRCTRCGTAVWFNVGPGGSGR